ncbi:MAG: Deoxyguanosinetriphosphate triphosphohydrolase, partial [Planctomycetota bacterium]
MALLHDIGHPPFGHCGEDALGECLKDHGGFSHNQFALELVTKIEQRYTDNPGLNLTHEVLAGQQFRSDKATSQTQMLEIQVVDAADSIAYDSHDVDDALKLGLLEWEQLDGLDLVERAKRLVPLEQIDPRLRRSLLVHTLLDLQMGDFLRHSSLELDRCHSMSSTAVSQAAVRLGMSPQIEQEKQQLEEFLFEHVYRHERLAQVRDKAAMRLRQLYRLLTSHPERLPERVRGWSELWGIERAVGAYLAGMTDRFCDDQYLLLVEMGRPSGIDWS